MQNFLRALLLLSSRMMSNNGHRQHSVFQSRGALLICAACCFAATNLDAVFAQTPAPSADVKSGISLEKGATEKAKETQAPLAPPLSANGSSTPTAVKPVETKSEGATASPSPSPSPSPALPSVPPQGATSPAISAFTTLVPQTGDSVNVDTVVLPAKPVAVIKGKETWEKGFERMTASLKVLEDSIKQNGLQVAGRPLTLFTQTDDAGFTYEMMLPIDKIPDGKTTLSPEVSVGKTPEGKALRFVHKGPYADIDSTYEAVTAYLDAKGLIVKDMFLEEYLTQLTKVDDPAFEANIFVQPKDTGK
jgi:effector-binding domain-containing protein